MYLSNLNTEQKELFRELCVFMAKADGYDDSERDALKAYCDEMEIPFSEETPSGDFKVAVEKLVAVSSKEEIKIVAFELMGIVYADGVYQDEERELIDCFANVTGLEASVLDKMSDLVKRIYQSYEAINKLLFE